MDCLIARQRIEKVICALWSLQNLGDIRLMELSVLVMGGLV